MASNDSEAIHVLVKDLKPGDSVLQFFELRSKDMRKTRGGDSYLDLTAGDATGTIAAKMWPEAIRKWGDDFKPGDFVKIEGRVETFRERNQLVVEKIRVVSASEVPDTTSLVRATGYDPDVLFLELTEKARALKPAEMAELVSEILARNADAFKTYPAARMVHHAYVGGLIEHVATMTRKVEAIAAVEPAIDRDLAVAGALLHDIGKLRELNPTQRGRTSEGRLIGHLILGVEMIMEMALEKELADRKWLRDLEHIVLAHHGELEFGSPVKPFTREAMLVHFVDNLDSRLKILDEALESPEVDGFSAYNKWLSGRAYAGSSALQEEE
jgi:3'-5' exoribonuclease